MISIRYFIHFGFMSFCPLFAQTGFSADFAGTNISQEDLAEKLIEQAKQRETLRVSPGKVHEETVTKATDESVKTEQEAIEPAAGDFDAAEEVTDNQDMILQDDEIDSASGFSAEFGGNDGFSDDFASEADSMPIEPDEEWGDDIIVEGEQGVLDEENIETPLVGFEGETGQDAIQGEADTVSGDLAAEDGASDDIGVIKEDVVKIRAEHISRRWWGAPY